MDEQRTDIHPPEARAREERDPARRDAGDLVAEPGQTAARPRRRWRRVIVWLLLLAAIIGAAVWFLPRLTHKPSPGGRAISTGAVPVGVATVAQGDMPVTLSGLGTVTPLATVTVKTQINGYLMSVGFQEGQRVKKGDFLAQIDPRPYQVALEQAEGQLGKDQASLNNAEIDLKRYTTLVAQNSIATQTRDTQAALVLQDRATIVSDKAAIDAQKLNLVYCHIISPVTGRVGLRQVDAGNYVQTSDANGIVVVTQTQPISVIFTLPEDNLPDVLKQLHAGATLQATAYDRTGTQKLDTGTLETVDNQIDTTTGTVKLRAIFNNPQEILFPNQFVNIKLLDRNLKERGSGAGRGDPARRAGHVCLSGQARPHGDGAKGEARSERRSARRDPFRSAARPERRRRRRRPAQGRRQDHHRPGNCARQRRAGAGQGWRGR